MDSKHVISGKTDRYPAVEFDGKSRGLWITINAEDTLIPWESIPDLIDYLRIVRSRST